MPVIKRYPNRKLYDTAAKQYITLDEIAGLIRSGEDIQVVDNATGNDLTAVTLTQIIFEQEKKQSGFLPRSVLAGLIKTGGDRLTAIQKTIMSSLGLWDHIDEEIERRVELLVHLGELNEEEGQIILRKLLSDSLQPEQDTSAIPKVELFTSEELEKHLQKLHIPTQDDMQKLLDQIDKLTEKIEDLTEN